MASIWSRDKQFGAGVGGFNAADGADGSNYFSIVPATTSFGLIFSNIVDATLTRSKVLATALYRSLQSQLHKEEDRATGSNLGVSGTGIESTQTVYTTPEQLPEIGKDTNDFTVSVVEADGDLTASQDMFFVDVLSTDRKNKKSSIKFSEFAVKWLKARTWKESELETKINNTIYGESTNAGLIPVGTIWDYCGLDDPTGFINLCLESSGNVRSISKTGGAGILKNDNYQNLFIKLYLNYSDALCSVSGGRSGADSTAALNDFISGKAISLPDYRGRVGGYYKLSDANFGVLGKQFGTDTITNEYLPEASPWSTSSSSVLISVATKPMREATDTGDSEDSVVDDITFNSGSPTITVNPNVGGGTKFFTPTIIQTAIIKY